MFLKVLCVVMMFRVLISILLVAVTTTTWIQHSGDNMRFNETQSYLNVHSSMYSDWYRINDHINLDGRLNEFKPDSFTDVYANVDSESICALLNYNNADGGILLVGGQETARFTIQLASLLKGKHCSVTCSSDISCTYCICDGKQKLAYIRNDDLSLAHSFPSGHCVASQKKAFKNRRRLNNSPLLCQSWASKQILSQFSVVVLNQDSVDEKATLSAVDFLVGATSGSQTLVLRTAFQSESSCNSNSTIDKIVLTEKYRGRVHLMDVLTPSQSYETRHANATVPMHGGTGKIVSVKDPHDMTDTMPVDGGRRRRSLLGRQSGQLRRASNSSPEGFDCIPFSYSDSIFVQSDFHLYWSDLLYTTLLLSYKPLLFDSHPCCTAPSIDIAQQQLVTIEFSIVNYMLAHQTMSKVLHFDAATTNPFNVVVLSVTDIAYEEAFASWFRTKDSIVPLHNSTIHAFIIGIDAESCEYFSFLSRPFLCFYYSSNFVKTFRTKGVPLRLAIGVSKLVYPALFLHYGYNVLFSEMDIFWRGDPIGTDLQAEANLKFDIQVSGHVDFWPRFITLPEELNLGIFYVKATHTSRGLFQDMLRYTCTHPHLMGTLGTWDQKLFDHFIRTDVPSDETPPAWGEHFPLWQSFITTNESVLWRRLPGEMYTHNQGPLIKIFPQTMAVHISWGKQKPSERIYCASQLGLVPSVPRFDEEYKGVHCFN